MIKKITFLSIFITSTINAGLFEWIKGTNPVDAKCAQLAALYINNIYTQHLDKKTSQELENIITTCRARRSALEEKKPNTQHLTEFEKKINACELLKFIKK